MPAENEPRWETGIRVSRKPADKPMVLEDIKLDIQDEVGKENRRGRRRAYRGDKSIGQEEPSEEVA
jgi:hypothetical protein